MMPTFRGVKPNQQNCFAYLKKISLKGWLTTHSELYGKSDHEVPIKTEEFHFLDMLFSSATADYNMGERAKKGSPTSTLHDRHCCGILSWTALEIAPYEVSCLSVILTRYQPEVIRKKVHVSIERKTIQCVRYNLPNKKRK